MVNLAVVVLGLLLGGAQAGPEAEEIFGPLFVSRPQDGPLLVVREQPVPPLIAIRLSVPFEEPPGLIGAARVLQLLVHDRVRSEVERFGGRVELLRTPAHLVYLVQGPASAFGDMVAILRYAVAPPQGAFRTQSANWLTARQEALADLETPDRLIRNRLEAALFPDLASGRAVPNLTEPPSEAALEEFWRRWFRPTEMSVVIVGAIDAETGRAAFRGWPEPPAPRPWSSVRVMPGAVPDPEVISSRAGLGYPASAGEPAALAVAAALIEELLAPLQLRQPAAELWWVGGKTALVVIGGAPTGAPTSAAQLGAILKGSVAAAAARAATSNLEPQRSRILDALVMRARTPGGMASVLGEFLDRTGEPESAGRFLAELRRVDAAAVRDVLRSLIYRPPIMVELDP
jgi:predicted Zn-dependent peptidase